MDPALHCGLAANFRRPTPAVPQIIGSCSCSVTGTAINNDIVLTGIIASINRLSLGEYQFNFNTQLPDINYFIYQPIVFNVATAQTIAGYIQSAAKYLTTGFQLEYAQMNIALYDPYYIRVLVFR